MQFRRTGVPFYTTRVDHGQGAWANTCQTRVNSTARGIRSIPTDDPPPSARTQTPSFTYNLLHRDLCTRGMAHAPQGSLMADRTSKREPPRFPPGQEPRDGSRGAAEPWRAKPGSHEDPFSRIAAAIPDGPLPKPVRPLRRSQSDFSELAPVVRPMPARVSSYPPPAAMAKTDSARPDTRAPSVPPPPLPSVIIEEPPPSVESARPFAASVPTARARRSMPRRSTGGPNVWLLLALSILMSGLGLAAFAYGRHQSARLGAPLDDTQPESSEVDATVTRP